VSAVILPAPLHELVALLAPPACPACRAPLDGAVVRLCPECAGALPWLPRGACPTCALPRHGARGCPAAGAAFERAWAPLAYEGVARDVVAALKFRGAIPVGGLMAAQLAANLPADLRPRAGEPAAIVPVPPQRSRRRRRGFDPADVLARALGRRLGLPVRRCLRRRDRAGRQVGASRAQRRRQGRIVVRACAPSPGRVLLLDDVHTTGATLEACARELRAAGAETVAAITYARTLRGGG
jgi:ComF family protein